MQFIHFTCSFASAYNLQGLRMRCWPLKRKQTGQSSVSHLYPAWTHLLLRFTQGGGLLLQPHSSQRLCVLPLSQIDDVLDLFCEVCPATLHHSGHQPRHCPRTCGPLSPGPVEQHVQHKCSQIIPVEQSVCILFYVSGCTLWNHNIKALHTFRLTFDIWVIINLSLFCNALLVNALLHPGHICHSKFLCPTEKVYAASSIKNRNQCAVCTQHTCVLLLLLLSAPGMRHESARSRGEGQMSISMRVISCSVPDGLVMAHRAD